MWIHANPFTKKCVFIFLPTVQLDVWASLCWIIYVHIWKLFSHVCWKYKFSSLTENFRSGPSSRICNITTTLDTNPGPVNILDKCGVRTWSLQCRNSEKGLYCDVGWHLVFISETFCSEGRIDTILRILTWSCLCKIHIRHILLF